MVICSEIFLSFGMVSIHLFTVLLLNFSQCGQVGGSLDSVLDLDLSEYLFLSDFFSTKD